MPVQLDSSTHQRVLLVLADRGIFWAQSTGVVNPYKRICLSFDGMMTHVDQQLTGVDR